MWTPGSGRLPRRSSSSGVATPGATRVGLDHHHYQQQQQQQHRSAMDFRNHGVLGTTAVGGNNTNSTSAASYRYALEYAESRFMNSSSYNGNSSSSGNNNNIHEETADRKALEKILDNLRELEIHVVDADAWKYDPLELF
jgi:hypothetical protein